MRQNAIKSIKKRSIRKSLQTTTLVCVRQNLVFKAVFESVSDDKYFIAILKTKKDHYPIKRVVVFVYIATKIASLISESSARLVAQCIRAVHEVLIECADFHRPKGNQ